jgi:colanic acid/amylovoran biosynthesis glycosyltransferase
VRLAYILSTFPCHSEDFVAREITRLREQDFTIRVFAAAPGEATAAPDASLRVDYRPSFFSLEALHGLSYLLLRHPLGLLRWLWLVLLLLYERPREAGTAIGNLPALGAFARSFDRARLGHIHAGFLSWPACMGLALAAVTGASLSIAAHARDVFVEPGALRLKVSRACFVVVCTRAALHHLQSRLPPACHAKLHVCYHGIDLPGGPLQARVRWAGNANNEYTLACVGRLVAKKGHAELLRAFATLLTRLPYCRLMIVGSGPERESLQRLTLELGLADRVEWKGWQPPEAARDIIGTVDLLVVPSRVAPDGDRDGIPNVILEAFAAATPVVATRLEGIAEAVTDRRTGVLVEPGDTAALAAAIEELLRDAHLRRTLARTAHRTARERFPLDRNTRQLAGLFGRVRTPA